MPHLVRPAMAQMASFIEALREGYSRDTLRPETPESIAQVAAECNRPRRTAARNFTFTRPLATPDTPGLVAAISDAVGELADGIAALLQ